MRLCFAYLSKRTGTVLSQYPCRFVFLSLRCVLLTAVHVVVVARDDVSFLLLFVAAGRKHEQLQILGAARPKQTGKEE